MEARPGGSFVKFFRDRRGIVYIFRQPRPARVRRDAARVQDGRSCRFGPEVAVSARLSRNCSRPPGASRISVENRSVSSPGFDHRRVGPGRGRREGVTAWSARRGANRRKPRPPRRNRLKPFEKKRLLSPNVGEIHRRAILLIWLSCVFFIARSRAHRESRWTGIFGSGTRPDVRREPRMEAMEWVRRRGTRSCCAHRHGECRMVGAFDRRPGSSISCAIPTRCIRRW